jgi:transposase
MAIPPRFDLSEAEKDALLAQQQEMIERLVARISELEALVGKPRKTSRNSHTPPSKDGFARGKKHGKPVDRRAKRTPLAG